MGLGLTARSSYCRYSVGLYLGVVVHEGIKTNVKLSLEGIHFLLFFKEFVGLDLAARSSDCRLKCLVYLRKLHRTV